MRNLFAFIALAVALPAVAAEEPGAADAQLIRMETAKWDASSLANPLALMDMFSTEMLSVDYGADIHGVAERRTWKDILAYGALPDWKVKLGEWRALHPAPDVTVLSYKVTGESVDWKAYATSIWARRDGRWKTVFYQVSTAK